MINKIRVNEPLNEKEAFDYHDWLREGRQIELKPTKVSALFKMLVEQINVLLEEIDRIKLKIKKEEKRRKREKLLNKKLL